MSHIDATNKEGRAPSHVYGVLILGVMSIAFAPVLVRIAQGEDIPSILIAASRLVLAALVLTPFALARHRHTLRNLRRADVALALLSGFFLAIHFASWITSLEYTSILLSTVIVTSSPIWVALLEFFFLRARLPRLVIVGLLIALAGGLLISFAGEGASNVVIEGQNDVLGAALSLVGAFAVSVYLIIGRKLGQNMPLIPYIWMVYGFAGLILSGVVIGTRTPITGYSLTGYLAIIGTTIFPQLLGHSSMNYAMKYLPATIVSMITQLEPVASSILAFIIFAELPFPLQIMGSGVVLIGVLLANIGQSQKRKQKSKQT